MSRVLVTGGAGFIGGHLCEALLREGHEVRVLDALDLQAHGQGRAAAGLSGGEAAWPPHLDRRVERMRGDIRDPRAVRLALEGVGAVVHLAAAVGVGQSMYMPRAYVDVNSVGTATLLEALEDSPVERLVVASSMSIYGEGRYETRDGAVVDDATRDPVLLRGQRWDPVGPDGAPLRPMPTPEAKTPQLASVYALTKYDQERMCLLVGGARGTPTVALRFFNVYGPRQALGNPYTGVLAIFASRVLHGRSPQVFEDGLQRRDFVSVHDAVRSILLAMRSERAPGHAINIGSGTSFSVLEAAQAVATALGRPDLRPEVMGRYRVGDVRHCFPDLGLARALLGYEPRVPLDEGLRKLGDWLREAAPEAEDRTEQARRELEARGLLA